MACTTYIKKNILKLCTNNKFHIVLNFAGIQKVPVLAPPI